MKKLNISPTLSLPLDFVTSTQGILGKKGKGKSYKFAVQAEELLDANQQVVIIDPTGSSYGLRSSADGKSAGYSITIFGGEHADLPLETTAGEVIASAIAEEHFSAIIDLSLFRKGEALRFMAAFLETLYRKNRHPLHLFIDEADVVAPQKTFSPEQARALGATDDLVRRGRIRGIGCSLITQRPQVLNKDVLSQIDMLTVLGMNHPKDIGAIKDWVAVHGDVAKAKQMIADLPALPVGEAWVWAPAADIFKRVTFRDRRTFDSGKTPKAGERKIVPKVLAPIDLERLGETIKATAERAKADDPKALKARIAELEKAVAKRSTQDPEVKALRSELDHYKSLPAISNADVKHLEAAAKRIEDAYASWAKFMGELRAVMAKRPTPATPPRPTIPVGKEGSRHGATGVAGPVRSVATVATKETERRQQGVAAGETAFTRGEHGDDELPIGERKVLTALVHYPAGLERSQLTVLTSYTKSTRNLYLQRLQGRGFVVENGGRMVATAEGCAALPGVEPLPEGKRLQDFWFGKLPAGEANVLRVLVDAYPDAIDRERISELTTYTKSTRNLYLQKLAAKELVADVGRASVKASDTLFEVV